MLQFLDEVFESGMLLCLCAFVFRAVNRQRQSVSWASARKTEIFTEARSSLLRIRGQNYDNLCALAFKIKCINIHMPTHVTYSRTFQSFDTYMRLLTEHTDLVGMMENGSLLL